MSAFVELTPELLAGFLDEAPAYLLTLEEGLLAFEQQCAGGALKLSTPADQERMNEIFRAAHSLKGASASLGFDRIRDLTHVMESLFDQVRHGMRELEARELQPLFTAVDRLRALLDEIAQPGGPPVAIDEALAELSSLVGDAKHVGHPAAAAPKSGCEMAHVDPALVAMFVQSTAESLDSLSERLLTLEQRPDDVEAVNVAFRDAHNIKGASGAVHCMPMHRLTHDMETVLDRVRSRELTIDADLITDLLAAVDRLRSCSTAFARRAGTTCPRTTGRGC
jgi:two-component system chemotaxis sensor kinase CheA